MQTILVFMLLAAACCVAGGILWKKRPEVLILPFFLSIPLYLFPWYCMDLLPLGMGTMLALWAVLIFAGGVKALRVREKLREMVTPGLALFFLFGFLFWLLTHNRIVCHWDELRLWGAVPKLLHYDGSLLLGKQADIFMDYQSYPPGMGLFLYAVTFFQPGFEDWVIFWGYAMFAMAFFLPLSAGLQWDQKSRMIPFVLGVLLLPCVFFSSGGDSAYYYGSLFIDPILGVAAGFGLYFAATAGDTPGERTLFGMVLGVILLLKESAALFAALWMVLYLGRMWKQHKKLPVKPLAWLLLSFLPILIWKWMMALHHVEILKNVNLGEFQIQYLSRFFYALATEPMVFFPRGLPLPAWVSPSFFLCVLCLLAGDAVVSFRLCKTGRGVFAAAAALILLSFGAFYYGYFTIYYEYLESLQRYSGTLLTMYLFYLAARLWMWLMGRDQRVPAKVWAPVQAVLIVVVTAFFLFYTGRIDSWDYSLEADAHAASLMALLEQEGAEDQEIGVYLITQEDSIHHHRIYYYCLGTNVQIRNFYYDASLPGIYIHQWDSLLESFRELDCSYLYIDDASGLQGEFRERIPDGEDGALYRIQGEMLMRVN